ncbi:MAG: L-threonine 3-dehydrogenase, partial [Opitutae bacterium]
MKALVKKKAEEGLWLEEVAKPEVAPHHVLVKVDRAG